MECYRLIEEAMGRYVKPPPKAKFQKGDKVKVTGEGDTSRFVSYHGKKRLGFINKEGSVIGYDYRPGSYSKFLVQFDDGTKEAFHSHYLIPARTEGLLAALDKTILLGPPKHKVAEVQDFMAHLKKFGYNPASEADLADFKKNLMRNSVFQNNLIRGIRTGAGFKSKYHPDNLRIHVIGAMRLYPTAPKFQFMTGYGEQCAPVFDKQKPVFYFWYASPDAQNNHGGGPDAGLVLSFPEIVSYDWEPAVPGQTPGLETYDQNFTTVKCMEAYALKNIFNAIEFRLSKGKKISSSFDYPDQANSLYRISKIQSIKDVKGVSQDDFDALMGL